MSTTRPATYDSNQGTTFPTEVSQYDRISGGLIASLVMGLFLFATLFLIWMFGATEIAPGNPPPPPPHTDRIVPITDEEVNVVEFDGSESQAFTESLEMTGASVAELSKSKSSDSDGVGIAGDAEGPGTGFGRTPGPSGGAGSPKWNVVQEAANLQDYQRKLDFFGIEIGAVHKSSDQIWRIADLSTKKVVTESSRSAESKPRHFVNQRMRLRQWDRETIAQAGVDLKDVIAVHFYPDQLIVKMQQLIDAEYEDQASKLKEVTFRIVGEPGEFRFEIEDVKFRN